MRTGILLLALLFISSASFAQGNNEALGGKTGSANAAGSNKKPVAKTVPKSAPTRNTASSSPCGVYYRNRADMIGESNLPNRWVSLGQSASKHFWYNPRKTTCDATTGVLKSWLKEEHKDTDGDFALVLYEFKCKAKQLRVKTVIEYDNAGRVLETTNHDDDEAWQDVAPGTAGEVMIRTACRQP
jgi:hypothetical protein